MSVPAHDFFLEHNYFRFSCRYNLLFFIYYYFFWTAASAGPFQGLVSLPSFAFTFLVYKLKYPQIRDY